MRWLSGLCVLAAGCRLGFDAQDLGGDAGGDAGIDPVLATTSVIGPAVGATELIPVALALTADGGSVIAGSVDRGTGFDWVVARLDPAGQLDASFGTGGLAVIDLGTDEDVATALAVGPGGEIVVVGETFAGTGNDHDSAVVRLTPGGQLDPAFGAAGVLRWPVSQVFTRDDRARTVAFDALGRVLVAGYTNSDYPRGSDTYVTRLTTTGAFDPTFAPMTGTGGMLILDAVNPLDDGSTIEFPRYLGVDSQGRIVVALTCSYDVCALRLTPDGEPDPAFGIGGLAMLDVDDRDELFDAALQADDKLLLAGTGATEAGPRRAGIARLTTTGALDPTFGAGGKVPLDLRLDLGAPAGDAAALAITPEPAGTILVGGSAHTGTREALAVVRLSVAGVRDTGFGGTYVLHGGGATARDLVVDGGGTVRLLARAAEHAAVIHAVPGAPWPAALLPAGGELPLTGATPTGPDLAYGDGEVVGASSRSAPLRAGQLSIAGVVRTSGAPAVFIHATRVTFAGGAVLAADGVSGDAPVGTTPGAGGAGASGGGAGAYEYSGEGGFGGRFGRAGISYGGVAGGAGFAETYARGFYYGRGGDGGRGETCCPGPLPGGEAGNGGGGGGGGAATNYATQGGGGGGGLIVIVADTVTGPGTLHARGGDGYNINGNGPGGGGGGVVWVAARSYDGALVAKVFGGELDAAERGQAGTARMFQILPDGTLVERAFTDAW